MGVNAETVRKVRELLGREPRGLEEVVVTGPDGSPRVIRVASLVDGKPFPTLFWLVDADLCYRIDREEAGGTIAFLQAQIDADALLQSAMAADHEAHIVLRDSFISDRLRQQIEALGYGGVLQHKGVGGIADFARIRCLHTWYAAHLVVPNTVGRMLDDRWLQAKQARVL
ncbi:MAG: DUF501 domain-containing protein [Pseudomonadota bacterium]